MEDVLRLIGEYLGPRELHKLTLTCRIACTWLNYDLVICSILCNGGQSGLKNLRILLGLASKGKIYMPSPYRLLQMSLGRRCERGSFSPGGPRQLQLGEPCPNRVLVVRRDYGVFLCKKCIQRFTQGVLVGDSEHMKSFPMSVLRHPRMTAWHYSYRNVIFPWKCDVIKNYSGTHHSAERVGPILSIERLEEIRSEDSGLFVAVQEFFASTEAAELGVNAYQNESMTRLFDRVESFEVDAEQVREDNEARARANKKARVEARNQRCESQLAKLRSLMIDAPAQKSKRKQVQERQQRYPIPEGLMSDVESTTLYKKLTSLFASAPSQVKAQHLQFIRSILEDAMAAVSNDVRGLGGFFLHPTTSLDKALALAYLKPGMGASQLESYKSPLVSYDFGSLKLAVMFALCLKHLPLSTVMLLHYVFFRKECFSGLARRAIFDNPDVPIECRRVVEYQSRYRKASSFFRKLEDVPGGSSLLELATFTSQLDESGKATPAKASTSTRTGRKRKRSAPPRTKEEGFADLDRVIKESAPTLEDRVESCKEELTSASDSACKTLENNFNMIVNVLHPKLRNLAETAFCIDEPLLRMHVLWAMEHRRLIYNVRLSSLGGYQPFSLTPVDLFVRCALLHCLENESFLQKALSDDLKTLEELLFEVFAKANQW
ncbi:hypothetical protein HDU96_006355 [Phlyctochytrium bullatum]|nr:hypothetical protein HDU96_006355 [Phlyctochytrium bullatum]